MARQRLFFFIVVLTLTGLHGSYAEPTAPPPLKAGNPAPESRESKREPDGKNKRDSDRTNRPESDTRAKRDVDGKDKRNSDGKDHRPDRNRVGDDSSDVPKKFRERFKNLSPEGQERFRQNWSKWRGMDPDEREKLMDRGLQDRQRCEEVIDSALRESDLELSRDEREVFGLRYRQERRKLEEELRDEVAKMRDERVKAMIERLKAEFSSKPAT